MLQMEPIEYQPVAPGRPVDSRLILITQGRETGRSEAALLSYRRINNEYLVIAITDGNKAKPDWYLNLKGDPMVEVEIDDVSFHARAYTPTGRARLKLLPLVREITQRSDNSVPRETSAILLSPIY